MVKELICKICSQQIKASSKEASVRMCICSKPLFEKNPASFNKVAESSSALLEKNIGVNEDKFLGMMHSIPFHDPNAIVFNATENNKKSIQQIVKDLPELGGRTDAEVILSLQDKSIPKSVYDKYPNLKSSLKDILKVIEKLEKNFTLFIQDSLYSGSNSLMEAQTEGVRSFLEEVLAPIEKKKSKLKIFSELDIKEIFKDDEADEKSAKNVVKALLAVSTLIPDKYKKKVPPLSVIIRGPDSKLHSGAALSGGKKNAAIVLNVRKNMILQAAEALHEYVHLVERFNPKVMKYSNIFLKARRTSKDRLTIKEISERYSKRYQSSAGDFEVYEGKFIDAYAGRTYGDLDGKNLVPTEVLTVGCEALFLEPTSFCVKDREYFDFIAKFLKGQI